MNLGTSYESRVKVWKGPEWPHMYNSTVSLGQILMNSLMDFPDHVAQICYDDGTETKNSEILLDSIRVALSLRDLGLKEGDLVGIAAKNSKNLAAVAIGAFAMGIPINTLDPTFAKDDIAHMFKITEPKIVFCDQENCEEMKKALKEIDNKAKIYLFGDGGEVPETKSVAELLRRHPEEASFVPPNISDANTLPAVVICSSGTTGPPKGVTLCHAGLSYQLNDTFLTEHHGRFLCFSSLYWLSGLATLVITTLQTITRVITVKPFSPELLVRISKERRVTYILTPPMQLALTLRHEKLSSSDLDSVRMWFCGGGHVSEENCVQLEKILKNGRVLVAYGCSEIAGLATKTISSHNSVGQLNRGMRAKVIDSQGMNLGPGERGEICLQTAVPIRGYYRNAEATKASIINGWYHTGDLGYFSENGDLHIVDRIKDILKVANYQVDPSELEMLIQKIPDVMAVSVFGLPDPIYTDLPTAMIVKAPNSKLTGAEVEAIVKDSLPSYKTLKGGVHFAEEMPLTPSGKILKRVCREIVMKQGDHR